jgi:hypothetical protein
VAWNGFLDECLRAAGAETAFAVGHEGLTIASRGRLPHGDVEGLGTRLMIALERAGEMEIEAGEVQSVLVEFDHRWLTGLALRRDGAIFLAVGVLGGRPVRGPLREAIRDGLRLFASHLPDPSSAELAGACPIAIE